MALCENFYYDNDNDVSRRINYLKRTNDKGKEEKEKGGTREAKITRNLKKKKKLAILLLLP